MLGKKLRFIYAIAVVCSMFIGCTTSKPGKLIINAPALGGEEVSLRYASRYQIEKLDENGQLSLELNHLMRDVQINVGYKTQFNCYIPQQGGIVEIDSALTVNFVGDWAEVNNFIQKTEFKRFDGRKLKADYSTFQEYVESWRKENLDILEKSSLTDTDFLSLKKKEINYGADVMYPVYLSSMKPEGYQTILNAKLAELPIDESLLNNDTYGYYLYRLSRAIVEAEHEEDALIPFEMMRLHLTYVLDKFESPAIREYVIHRTATDYVFQQGNDPVLDETYHKYVNDPYLKPQYTRLSEKWDGLWTGQPFNTMDFTNLAGDSLNIKAYKGKYALYHIWATWCRPCVRELNIMLDLEKDFFKNTDFEYVTLSVDENHDRWEAFLKSKEMDRQQCFNSRDYGSLEKEYSITTISRFFLCDKEGNLLSPNFIMPSEPEFKKIMTRLLDKPES